MAGPIKKIFGYMGDFVKGVWSGDWQGDALGEKILPNGIKGIPESIGELRNDFNGTTSQNKFNSTEAQKQRDFEKMMSDTSYQRAVEDMQRAGINPAMMYASGGNGASTPSGANASGGTGRSMDVIGQMGNLMNSINTARQIDYYTKRDEIPKRTTEELYNSMGELIRTIVKTSI